MRRGALFMLGSALAFCIMTALVKLAGERPPSQEIVLARAIIPLAPSLVLIRRASISPWGNARGLLVLRSVFGFLGLSCVFSSVTRSHTCRSPRRRSSSICIQLSPRC
jgi:drug/metabolite transporter (DMT)-like permease